MGTIDGFQVALPTALYSGKNLVVDTLTISVFVAIFIAIGRIGKIQWLKQLFVVLIVMGIGASTVSLWQSRGLWQTDESKTIVELPSYNDRLLSFSKDKPNIVVLFLDAFTGSHVGDIMKDGELREKYRGFTWYSNTLSTSSYTKASVASIICGEKCTPWELEKESGGSIADKINKNYADEINRFGPDFDVALYERNWLEINRIGEHLQSNPLLLRYLGDNYLNRYIEKNGIEIGRGSSDSFLLAVSLFNSVPWSLKNMIYKDGRWIERLMPSSDLHIVRSMREYAFLDALPENSNTDSQKATYKFLGNEVTHSPWFLDWKSCKISQAPGMYDELKPYVAPQHVASEKCALSALGNWFNWMRKVGIFDNTMIVLVSDHDSSDSEKLRNLGSYANRRDGLLLVKNLGDDSSREMRISKEIHSIYDVPVLIYANLKGATGTNSQTRTTVLTHSDNGLHYKMDSLYKVKGLIEEKSSWQRVE